MKGALFLAWRYLAYHRVKTAVLAGSITLIVFLPLGLRVLVARGAEELSDRADATPLLVGKKGSPLELVLNSLYFKSESPDALEYAEVTKLIESGLALPIPLHVRFRSRQSPIVGTTVDYFRFRGLHVAEGRMMTLLGECVLGSTAAARLEALPGDHVLSSPESVFDLAGVYPLRMRVAGILEPSATPDDEAVFVDIKTAWIMEGLGHGHEDLARPAAAAAVLKREGNRIVANASVVQYNEITPENIESFHFHGDTSAHPITAVIAVPRDEKSAVLLRGRYASKDGTAMALVPSMVMDDLLDTILTVEQVVVLAVIVVGIATLATTALVFMLSLRLRKREIETMMKIGAARGRVAAILALEVGIVLASSFVLAVCLTVLTGWLGSGVVRMLLV